MEIVKTQTHSYQKVLISACLLLMLSFGYRAGFGLFMVPMSEAREWGRDVFGLALAIQNLSWGVCAILAGALADKFGNLRVLLGGVALYAIGMVGMSISSTETQIVSTAGLLVGAGVAGTSFGIVLPSIARAVPEEKRARALGIGTAAGSFGQFLVVPVIASVVNLFGWMHSLQFLGISAFLMALLCIPLSKFGGANETAKADSKASISLKYVALKACSIKSYRLLVFGFFVCGFHVAFITIHMPGYLVDLGFDPQVGAWSISLIGLCNVIGAYYAGVLSGTHSMRALLTMIYLGRVMAITIFLAMPVSILSIMLFSAGMGFLWLATVPPTSGLVALFFGTRYMSFLYGIVFLSHQLGSFSGVWLGAWLYEHYGSYNGIWYAGIFLGIVAALLHWPIKENDYSESLLSTAPSGLRV